MFVTMARIGLNLRKDPSLSSDSTTRKSLWPTRAFEPPMAATLPPTTTVGSNPATLSTLAIIDVVVVLPWQDHHDVDDCECAECCGIGPHCRSRRQGGGHGWLECTRGP